MKYIAIAVLAGVVTLAAEQSRTKKADDYMSFSSTAIFTNPPVPKTPKEAAEAIKKLHPYAFTDGKIAIVANGEQIATLYDDGRIEMKPGHTVEELTWLLLWSVQQGTRDMGSGKSDQKAKGARREECGRR